jgi:hypothetical protein
MDRMRRDEGRSLGGYKSQIDANEWIRKHLNLRPHNYS